MAVTQGVTLSTQTSPQRVDRDARVGRWAGVRSLGLVGLSLFAACAGIKQVGGPSGAAGSSSGASGNPFAGTNGSTTGGAGQGGAVACMQGKYSFVPKTPTVFLLVDQSGSMFGCRTTGGAKSATANECASHTDTSWYPLREGVLQVVQTLGAEVRFGFAAFTGEAGDAMCPQLTPVTPTLDNYAAIAARYNALVPPRKGETPTRNALASVGALLAADQAPGEKFILFVTDGQPDYCDDGNELCPPDSVVGELQTLSKAGVKTLVFGISSPLSTVSDVALAGFANAGAGQPVAPLVPDLNAIFDQCAGVTGWAADFATTGKQATRGHTVGDYTPAGGGTAKVFKPDLTNQQALVGAISAALSGVKSCVFDLGKLEGKAIKVDLTQLAKAHVLVMGTQIPLDDANGWSMTTDTQLQLSGAACETWRKPENTMIDFQFPCEVIVVE